MNIFLSIASCIVLPLVLMSNATASVTLLTGGLNVDNGYTAYISTDDSISGTTLSSAVNWVDTQSIGTVDLTVGQDYFLHILADNITGPAGFLGDFSLSGSNHMFSNGNTFLTTNTTDWLVSASGWGSYGAVTSYGTNGVSPWGDRTGVNSSAEWIWLPSVQNYQNAYFTTQISATSAVPEPSIIALMLGGLGLVGFMTRRKQA